MESKREDRILMATFCGISPNNWLPNYDTDWNALMEAISLIEKNLKRKFTIPRNKDGYSIEETYLNVLSIIQSLNK